MDNIGIESGSVFVYYAFDIGLSIDIPKAEQILSAEKKKTAPNDKRRQTKYFEYTPPPLRWVEDAPVLTMESGFSSLPKVEFLLFDFGSVSVRFEIPVRGPFSGLIKLSSELYENFALKEAARSLIARLLRRIQDVVEKPDIAARVEDYCIFHLARVSPALSVAQLLESQIFPVTCILRAESGPPSDREVQEILSDRISYGSNDVTFISWHAAVIYGENAEDIYAVLEFTNLVLLELSYLDANLDRSLDEYYDYFTKRGRDGRLFGLRSRRQLMRRISQAQIESAILFERITNALKLMGDDFQARVFRLATRKMGLSSWDASISKKLQTIESLYQKISDSEAARRMEVLEFIIIILILVSIFV